MQFLYYKSLHIIFVVTWFAGLFYSGRLFIYHMEANKKPAEIRDILQNQYKLMTKRLWYIITFPSAILASLFAFLMLYENPAFLMLSWMHIKLSFVFLLYIYHWKCHKIFVQLQNDIFKYTAFKLRLWNEIPTIILFAVVFLVVLKDNLNWIWGILGLVAISIVILMMVKFYKKIRKRKKWEHNEK